MFAQKTNACVGKMQNIFVVWLHKKIMAQLTFTLFWSEYFALFLQLDKTSLLFIHEVLFLTQSFLFFWSFTRQISALAHLLKVYG